MLQSLWQLLANFGVDVDQIAEALKELIWLDPDTNEYVGQLSALIDVPVVGDLLKALVTVIPDVQIN